MIWNLPIRVLQCYLLSRGYVNPPHLARCARWSVSFSLLSSHVWLHFTSQLVRVGVPQRDETPPRHLGPADRPGRRLLSCLIPVKVDQTARLLRPARRKNKRITEKRPADLLLGFNQAVKSKARSLLERPILILALCLDRRSSSPGRGRQPEQRWDKDDTKLQRRMFTFTLTQIQTSTSCHSRTRTSRRAVRQRPC